MPAASYTEKSVPERISFRLNASDERVDPCGRETERKAEVTSNDDVRNNIGRLLAPGLLVQRSPYERRTLRCLLPLDSGMFLGV